MTNKYERIDSSPEYDSVRDSHHLRYHIANGFTTNKDVVLDAGCGIAYGRLIMDFKIYWGVDINITYDTTDFKSTSIMMEHDFNNKPFEKEIDVFVGFEIIEHLEDQGVKNFVATAKQAEKWIIVSTPIIPTKHRNEWHLQDFTPEQMIDLFQDKDWKLYGWLKQQEIYGIFIFKRI